MTETSGRPSGDAAYCNGEQAVGFKNLRTGKFEEIMLIRDEAGLRAFKGRYGVNEITKEY